MGPALDRHAQHLMIALENEDVAKLTFNLIHFYVIFIHCNLS